MATGARLRGMAWDHPRARLPLAAVSAAWSERTGIAIDWDARPLKAFEDQPLAGLASAYDLVLMDYPFVGTAAASGLIVAVEDWADADYLRDQRENSVGPSYASYTWNGRQWALAIDAATQVSAVREDLLAAASLAALPSTWDEVLACARALRSAPARIAIPLNPNHAYCAFLSVGLAARGPDFWRRGERVESVTALAALEYLRELAPQLHPLSGVSDPIAIADRMAGSDEILYVPLMFGYSNYARRGFRRNTLRFGNAPSGASGHIGSVLGGVGIALSARCAMPEAAADLARTLVSPAVQAGLYVESGGQPGHGAAWQSDTANAVTGGFFRATRETMEQAFLRPRVPGHRRFQEEAGLLAHRCIWDPSESAKRCVAELDRLTDELLGRWETGGEEE